MHQFHETYSAPEFLAQLVRERECDAKRIPGPKAVTAVDHRHSHRLCEE